MSQQKDLVLGYCPLGNGHDIHPFDEVFSYGKSIANGFDGVDAVVFWGGTDIHPSFYGQERHSLSQALQHPSQRDLFEWRAMVYCKLHKIPMIGVCRGAQMMCAFAGGTLVQHADGHNCGHHAIVNKEGEVMNVTSAHHQMMYPWDVPHELLAWSSPSLSRVYQDGQDKEIARMKMEREPEIVYFPKVNGLAIQGHPEWMKSDSRLVQYFNELIIDKLLMPKFEESQA